MTGGSIYNALIAQATVKAKVNVLLTLNPNHFNRLGEDMASIQISLDIKRCFSRVGSAHHSDSPTKSTKSPYLKCIVLDAIAHCR